MSMSMIFCVQCMEGCTRGKGITLCQEVRSGRIIERRKGKGEDKHTEGDPSMLQRVANSERPRPNTFSSIASERV